MIAVAALLLLAFSGYIKGAPPLAGLPDITLMAAGVTAAILFFAVLSRRSLPPVVPMMFLLASVMFLGYVAPYGASAAYSREKMTGAFLITPLLVLGASVLLLSVRSRRLWLVGVVALAYAAWGLAQVYPDAVQAERGVVALAGSNTIAMGRGLGAAMVVLICAGIASKGKWRILLLVAGVLTALAMVLSGSRGPVVSAGAAILAVALFTSGKGRVRRILIVLAAAAGAAYFAFTRGLVSDRLVTVADESALRRERLFGEAWDLMWSQPLGVGWGRLGDHLSSNAYLTSVGARQYPHNLFLEVGSEAGVLALVLLIVILLSAFKQQRRRATTPVEFAMLGLFVFYLVAAMFSGDINDNRGVWVMVGACLTGVIVSRATDGTVDDEAPAAPAQSLAPARRR